MVFKTPDGFFRGSFFLFSFLKKENGTTKMEKNEEERRKNEVYNFVHNHDVN